MNPVKKVLILCDAHDCLRHEGNYTLLLKQLYVTVFLLKKHFGADDHTLHINNRAVIGFDVFWNYESRFYTWLDDFIIQKPWREIDMPDYDLVIVHPDQQHALQRHLLQEYGTADPTNIYAFSEFQYGCHMIYKTAGSLFTKGGLLQLDRSAENNAALSTFKQELDQAADRFTIDRQEAVIPQLARLMENNNRRLQVDTINKVLIIDDYKRAYFIGDSVHWLAKIRKLIDLFPEDCSVCLNVANKAAFNPISTIFQRSLPERIAITHYRWEEMDPAAYDLVLCNNDIFLKFLWHLDQQATTQRDTPLLYSFSVMDERRIEPKPTPDFYTNLFYNKYGHMLEQADKKLQANLFTEISLLQEEHARAADWLVNKGVSPSDKLIVLLHEASSSEKVLYDSELLKLIKRFGSLDNRIKILLVSEKMMAENTWLHGALTGKAYNNVVVAESLPLRQVMSLLGNKQVAAVIGPCTGLMHLADAVYSYLMRHIVIAAAEWPLLLTYTGKQAPERNYHPNNWWKHSSNVHCCVAMLSVDGEQIKLIPLHDCAPDLESFNNQSAYARDLSSDRLFEFIQDTFPGFIKGLGATGTGHSEIHLPIAQRTIPTFIINLKHRVERRNHILAQFAGRPAFDCTLVNAIENENGRLGLWLTIKQIVSANMHSAHEYILLIEDDHEFTGHYTNELLFSCIDEAKLLHADILLGGICFCDHTIEQVHNNLVAVEHFACTQFTILFRSFFQTILDASFTEDDCADLKMVKLSNRKLVIYPFISKQKDFGYSDVSSGYYENKMTNHVQVTSNLIREIIKYEARENKVSAD